MKIALYHTTLPTPDHKVGGVEVVVHRLANTLVRQGHSVTVFSLSPAPDDALYATVQLFRRGASLLRRPLLRMSVLPLLLNLISFRGYDVVHFHGDDWFYLRRSVPSVRTLHGSALHEARTATSWKRWVGQLLTYPLEHLAVRLATRALAVGPETTRLYPRTHLINNGVNLSLFQPGEKAARPTVVFVGTWAGRKRGAFLFGRFVEEVLPRVPDARLVMVSDYVSDSCAAHPNVEYWAHPSDAELAELYRRAWVFAYPSTYEGFGLPYIEALASGTAVLCSPNDGADHVLERGAFGLVVDDSDFGGALATLLRSEASRALQERAGLDRAAQFSWDAVARAHLDHYRALAPSPVPPSPPVSARPVP
jgi:glycosyltransferase involved in cell wall biosynthesis